MDLLTFLAKHRGEVVSRERILNEVWEKEYVSDGTLRHAVAVLRQSLGDDARNPRYIETISTRGYRLIAELRDVTEPELESIERSEQLRQARRRRFGIAGLAAGFVVAVVVVIVWARVGGVRTLVTSRHPSVAVLPFEDLGDSDDASFAAGMTDELAVRLSAVRRLAVVTGPARLAQTNGGKGAREMGEELGVDFVLEGTVRSLRGADGATRVRITPRLLRVVDGTTVWAEVYDSTLVDVFETQSDIARRVTERLHLSLLEPERQAVAPLESRLTDSEEAYQLFLRGRGYSTSRDTAQDISLAVSMFQQAFDLDPKFALAEAELARAHSRLYHFGADRSEKRQTLARQAAEGALRLAPADPRVNLAIAFYYYWVLRDFDQALSHLTVAEKSLGNDPEVLEALAFVLRRQGAYEEALERQKRALEGSPLDALMAAELGNTLCGLGRFQEADDQFRHAIALAPDLVTAYAWRAQNYWLWKGETEESRATLDRMPGVSLAYAVETRYLQCLYDGRLSEAGRVLAESEIEVYADQERYYPKPLLEAEVLSYLGEQDRAQSAYDTARSLLESEQSKRPDDPRVCSALGVAYAGLGRSREAVNAGRSAVQLCPVERDAWSGPAYVRELARIHVMVGEFDQAIAELERLLARPNRWISGPLLRLDPRWAPLQGHPRFQALLERYSPVR